MTTTNLDADLDRFVGRLRARLEAGARTYGNSSFKRPIAELIGEVMEEAEDICGWAFLAWFRLEQLRGRVVWIERMGGQMVNFRAQVRSVSRASAAERRTGLIAYLAIEYGDVTLDSVVVRRTLDLTYVLSFPQRRDRAGRGHALVKPIDAAARAKIERQVLAQLDLEHLDAPEADDG